MNTKQKTHQITHHRAQRFTLEIQIAKATLKVRLAWLQRFSLKGGLQIGFRNLKLHNIFTPYLY